MKIFAVWCRVKLTKKPDWLDAFQKKYNNPYDFHVTLKQECWIDEDELRKIKSIVSNVIKGLKFFNHNIDVTFNKLDADKDDKSIMILTQNNKLLMDLQKKIRISLVKYNKYRKPELETYEKNFKPHLTIAFGLGDKFDEAKNDIGKNITCVGEITEIILSCVKEHTIEEAINPKNMTVYKL